MVATNILFSAYCACHLCCGPTAPNPTAMGTWPVEGRTIAGPRNIPLGTWVRVTVEGKAYRFRVEDRTARKWDGKRWDVFLKSHEAARKWGLKRGSVEILP